MSICLGRETLILATKFNPVETKISDELSIDFGIFLDRFHIFVQECSVPAFKIYLGVLEVWMSYFVS